MPHQISWVREEIVLATDLLRQNDWLDMRASDPRIATLSLLLRSDWVHPSTDRPASFRNTNSVSRKVSDIFTQLPHYAGRSTKGNRLDKVVLDEFLAAPHEMTRYAARLRAAAGQRVDDAAQAAAGAPSPLRAPQPAPVGAVGARTARTPVSLPDISVPTRERVTAFMASPRYAEQRQRSGRRPLPDQVVRSALEVLVEAGGRASGRQLSAAAGFGEVSFAPTFAALRRLLNVDGSQVVAVAPDGLTVRLDVPLLVEPMLGGPAGRL
ncbi:hypothetical protein [Cellulomonas endophytica]|uniref:hypothetical protein n=1 Tax=Cellulomonas endophytica TaxID=2494735 RepID=UPI001012C49C|nr:hypothetical protein [Cellulomonas endophytica]